MGLADRDYVRRFACGLCGIQADNRETIANHIRNDHHGVPGEVYPDEQLRCPYCHFLRPNLEEKARHLQICSRLPKKEVGTVELSEDYKKFLMLCVSDRAEWRGA